LRRIEFISSMAFALGVDQTDANGRFQTTFYKHFESRDDFGRAYPNATSGNGEF
jgi:hypothetical protein